ncbi:hypothetical protein FS837_004404 [Tulasnella sp. UAMH 9824]|nr:hypothetical protein FS837_004404 [Tulasnella sp. UAMH 9824]
MPPKGTKRGAAAKKSVSTRNTPPVTRSGIPVPTVRLSSEPPSPEIGRRGDEPSLSRTTTPINYRSSAQVTPIMSIGGMPMTPTPTRTEQTIRLTPTAMDTSPIPAPPFATPFQPTSLDPIDERREDTTEDETEREEVGEEVRSEPPGGYHSDKQTPSKSPWSKLQYAPTIDQEEEPYAPKMVSAQRRSVILRGVRADKTRERKLQKIHNDLFPGKEIEDCWLDPTYEEGELSHLFELLDQFIRAKAVPGRTDYYYADRHEWSKLHFELSQIYNSRRRYEPGWLIHPPPVWPGQFRTDEPGTGEYTFTEIEERFILYRHLVETWLAKAWHIVPLEKDQRIAQLPETYQRTWKDFMKDRSGIADEYQEILGEDYERQIEEDTIARLTAELPQRPRRPPPNLDQRLDQESTDSEKEVRNTLREAPFRSGSSSRTSRRSEVRSHRGNDDYIRTPERAIPDQLGDRNRGRRITELFAPSQFAQAQSSVRRTPAATSSRIPRVQYSTQRRAGAPGGPPDDSSSDSTDPRRPPRRTGDGRGLPNLSPNLPPSGTPFRPPPGPPPPRRYYGPPPPGPPNPPGPPGPPGPPDGGNDTFSWFGEDDNGWVRYYVDRKPVKVDVPHIEMKLKPEHIEEWDGDADKIFDWMEGINFLAERSPIIWKQLGSVVPTRFKRNAKTWWQSLPWDRRTAASTDWDSLKAELRSYYMGRSWLDRQKLRAKNATYRDSSAPKEKPSEYYIRKLKLLHTAESYTETELILAIMEGAPKYWHSVIDTSVLRQTVDLQDKIIYHEDALMYGPGSSADGYDRLERRIRAIEQGHSRGNKYSSRVNKVEAGRPKQTPLRGKVQPTSPRKDAHAHLIGFHRDLGKPPFPRDDKTVAKGKTPEEKGARPCRHCGSPKHWDNECKYARKGSKKVKANFASPSEDYLEAMSAYEEAYLDDSSEGEVQEAEDEAESPDEHSEDEGFESEK